MPMKLSSNINNSILTRKHSNVIFEPRGGDNVENNIIQAACTRKEQGRSINSLKDFYKGIFCKIQRII